MTGLLEIEDVAKYFRQDDTLLRRLRPDQKITEVKAVDGVNLTVEEGETVGLVGESGCGKSTLARLMLRFIEPTAGRVQYRGEDVLEYTRTELKAFREQVQMIFQDPFTSLNPRYTVRRTLTEPMEIHGIGDSRLDRERRSAQLLKRVRLGSEYLDRYPHELSGGQRQRVAIARALTVEPELLIADEPTSALDVSVQVEILDLLDELRAEMNLSMVFITHDLSVVRHVSDRVAVMYLGYLVEVGPTSRLFSDPEHPYTQALLSSVSIPGPDVISERIPLEGDVPTPIDPPEGCRFHPRCPKIIPSEAWQWNQPLFREMYRFKMSIADGTIDPSAMRETLRQDGDSVEDDTVVDALYREYIKNEVEGTLGCDIPGAVESVARDALTTLVDGYRSRAVDDLESIGLTTVCRKDAPGLVETGDGRKVRCHLHTDVGRSRTDAAELLERDKEKILGASLR
jgi:peptide/nickel transport system ATP-binding protein